MKRVLLWLVVAVVVALGVHLGTMAALPYYLMRGAEAGVARHAHGTNRWIHAPPATGKTRVIVRPSPDLLDSACVLDLTKGPIRIQVHPVRGYWSLSLFAANSDNVHVWDDRTAPAGVDIVLSEGHAQASSHTIHFPSSHGMAIVRRLPPSPADFSAALQIRKQDVCEAMK